MTEITTYEQCEAQELIDNDESQAPKEHTMPLTQFLEGFGVGLMNAVSQQNPPIHNSHQGNPIAPYGNPFYAYVDCASRDAAIEAGLLIDIPELSALYFKAPVAVSREVWESLVAINNDAFKDGSKLLSIFCSASKAIKRSGRLLTEVCFFVQSPKKGEKVCLKISAGPMNTHNLSPVLTIMFGNQPFYWLS